MFGKVVVAAELDQDGDAEYTARNAANMAFLDDLLQKAYEDDSTKLVVIASQANPFERFLETGFNVSGFGDFIGRIRNFVANNPNKKMLYIHGDTHTPRFSHLAFGLGGKKRFG